MDYIEVLEKQIKVLEAVQKATGTEFPQIKVNIAWCIASMIGQLDNMLMEWEEVE